MTIESAAVTLQEMPAGKEFATTDIKLAAVLITRGVRLLRVDRSRRKGTFVFENSAEICQQIEVEFPSSEACGLFAAHASLVTMVKS